MKLYRVEEGVIVESGPRAYSFETDWDELINRNDLLSINIEPIGTLLNIVE